MNLEQYFPDARPWVENLASTFPGSFIKPQFAYWEILHVLSLIMLGGTTILISLRLAGVGLVQEPPSEIHRNLKLWQNVGVIGIVVTGLLIGSANAERLYDSAAFIVKMLALIGGIILTYGAMGPVARAEGMVGVGPRIWLVLGLVFWGLALALFATSGGISPGVFHILTAAGLMVLFIARGRLRWIYLAGLALLVAVQTYATHIAIRPDDYARLDPVNKGFAVGFTVWIVGCALFQLFRAGRQPQSGPLTKIIGYATILVWITAAAAGRWIAFA